MLCLAKIGGSEKSEQLIMILRILGVIQVCLGVFLISIDFTSGIELEIGAALLFLTVWSNNWCSCLVYIIICMQDALTSIKFYGEFFVELPSKASVYDCFVVLSLIKYPFYLVSIHYAFIAYRELKALFIERVTTPRISLKFS